MARRLPNLTASIAEPQRSIPFPGGEQVISDRSTAGFYDPLQHRRGLKEVEAHKLLRLPLGPSWQQPFQV
jgi:hypothetical protein